MYSHCSIHTDIYEDTCAGYNVLYIHNRKGKRNGGVREGNRFYISFHKEHEFSWFTKQLLVADFMHHYFEHLNKNIK